MARIAYDEQMAAAYDRGRALTIEGLAAWHAALAPYLPGPSSLPVLDLGSGTGVFAAAMQTTPAPVVDCLDLLVLR